MVVAKNWPKTRRRLPESDRKRTWVTYVLFKFACFCGTLIVVVVWIFLILLQFFLFPDVCLLFALSRPFERTCNEHARKGSGRNQDPSPKRWKPPGLSLVRLLSNIGPLKPESWTEKRCESLRRGESGSVQSTVASWWTREIGTGRVPKWPPTEKLFKTSSPNSPSFAKRGRCTRCGPLTSQSLGNFSGPLGASKLAP